MRTVQQGDRVQVHYVKRLQNGPVASSRGRAPLEVTVGIAHPRLPGLGLALVGLAPGEQRTLTIPAERAYGVPDPRRVRRLARTRIPEGAAVAVGERLRLTDGRGRRRVVRILEVRDDGIVVDANHPWAGQAVELKVKLVAIHSPGEDVALPTPDQEALP
jgi:FKBP-type peptidyl-prolyl cis-trans isomerase 2